LEDLMTAPLTLLKALLGERHLQTHPAFCREYTAVAHRIDPRLVVTAPGREQYQRWLSGKVKTRPHPDHCRVLERMFPGHTVTQLLAPPGRRSDDQPASQDRTDPVHEEEKDTNRRELLFLGGAAMAGAAADLVWREPGRMLTALDTSSVGQGRLAELFQEATQLGVRVIKVPPGTLAAEAMMGFREVRELIGDKQTLASHRELVRVAAMFGTVVGEIMFNEGQFALAQRWYNVARRAALEVGDQYLADIALSGSTYLPTYSADPRGVLALVATRLDEAPAASPAIAWLWAFRAKAHALLNEQHAFETCIERSRRALDGSPDELVRPGIFSFLPEKLAFYEARGRVELGDVTKAIAAAQRASDLYDFTETTEPALVRFEQASALVQAGEIPEACRFATTAILDQRTYHGISIHTRAKEFDQLLGTSSQEAAKDWREVLATLRPPQLALTETR
jgi:tetratricopeptide (TPR) repeat protein